VLRYKNQSSLGMTNDNSLDTEWRRQETKWEGDREVNDFEDTMDRYPDDAEWKQE